MVGGMTSSRSRELRYHILNHKQGAESELEVRCRHKLSKPIPSDVHLPAWLHFLESVQTAPSAMDPMFKSVSLCGTFLIQVYYPVENENFHL